MLEWIRAEHALSIHGVGLSIGGMDLDTTHLERVAALVARYEPAVFSEHLAWSSHGERFLNDLLPLPYDAPTLARVCDHVDQIQTRLGRRILIENPATYVTFATSTMSEGEFMTELVARTGCGLLLDVCNAFISAHNHGRDPWTDMLALPLHATGEIHLAGFATDIDESGEILLIDAHNGPIATQAWALYQRALRYTGAQPTLVEWDNALPPFDRLLREAARVDAALRALPQCLSSAA